MSCLLLVAGGTGGHLFPAIALAQASKGIPVVLLTDKRGARFCQKEAKQVFAKILVLPGLKKERGILATPVNLFVQFWVSWWHVLRLRPQAVWGFGGRITIFALLYACSARIPSGIHQSDRVMGKANRFLARIVTYVALGHKETQLLPKKIEPAFIGTPVRKGFDAVRPLTSITMPLQVLVLGGSQGSAFWGTCLPEAMALLSEKERASIHIVHQSPQGVELPYPSDVSFEAPAFIDDMPAALEKAHVVLTRAGGSCLAELCAAGRPAFFVPYPYAKDAHQLWNASYAVEQGAGWMCVQKDVTAEKLAHFLRHSLYNPQQLLEKGERMRALGEKGTAESMAHFIQKGIRGKTV